MHPLPSLNSIPQGSTRRAACSSQFSVSVKSVGGDHIFCVPYTKQLFIPFSGWAKKHEGNLPELEEITSIWQIPEKTDPNYERKVELLLWYVDELIPSCVGHEQFGPNIRHYTMMVSIVNIDGKMVPQVPAKGESMGWVIYANFLFPKN